MTSSPVTAANDSQRSPKVCTRLWQAEACRDGRISGEELVSFQAHAKGCTACAAEILAIEKLAQTLKQSAPEVDAIALRRTRNKVLEAANAQLLGRLPSWGRRHAGLLTGAAAAAVLAIVGASWLGTGGRELGGSGQATKLDTVDEGNAQWSRRSEAEVERVDLHDGTLRLSVKRPASGKRLVVQVPDGEIEDIGTVFHVSVVAGHTDRVGVDEGQVTLRIRGEAPITLFAGQSWKRRAVEPAQPASPANGVTAEAVPTVPSTPKLGPSSARPTSSTPVAPATATALSVHHTPLEASTVAAMPKDAAEEDAAYLQVVSLVRAGKTAEAQTAAKLYLRRFPDGFRREEMGRVAE
jgi:FecR protein